MNKVSRLQFLSAVLVFCFSFAGFAQESPKTEAETTKDLVMGKALYLAVPTYPENARAIGLSETISVKIAIDENGNVTAAKAKNGNPIFHKSAEAAALSSKFTPTTLSGKPVEVSATISFNFFIQFQDWERIGMTLKAIESKIAAVGRKTFESDTTWQGFEDEKVEYYDLISNENLKGKRERARDLIKGIEIKLKYLNPTEFWYFKLGISTCKLIMTAEKTDSKKDFQNDLKTLESFIKSAPSDVPKERLDALTKVTDYLSKGELSKSDRIEIAKLLIDSYNQKLTTK